MVRALKAKAYEKQLKKCVMFNLKERGRLKGRDCSFSLDAEMSQGRQLDLHGFIFL